MSGGLPKSLQVLRWLPLIAVTACAYVPLEQSPYQEFAGDFEAGVATRKEIVDALGPPNTERGDYRYLLYEWESDGALVMHPAVAVFACTSPVQGMPGTNRDTLLMEFDEDGRLQRSDVVRNSTADRAELLRRFEAGEPVVQEAES